MEPDSKILLVDGLNTFIRSFAANPTMNDNGIHIGGIAGFLLSIGHAIKSIGPTRVIICFDGKGGSARRRKLFPDYKAQRRVKQTTFRATSVSQEDEKVSMQQQLARLIQYLDCMPVTTMAIENIEADDAIAYICQQIYTESDCVIMSTDKDYLQLADERVSVWSPTKKKFYFGDTVRDEFGIDAKNFLEYRALLGDKSDNIGGIRGAGPKSLQKALPQLFGSEKVAISDIINYSRNLEKPSKLVQRIGESADIIERNFKLMQLREVDISGSAKMSIMNIVRQPINRLSKLDISKMMLEDLLNASIRNPDVWLKDVFFTLDNLASKTHNND